MYVKTSKKDIVNCLIYLDKNNMLELTQSERAVANLYNQKFYGARLVCHDDFSIVTLSTLLA